MLDTKTRIEQLIYTACGRKDDGGAFGFWSKSFAADHQLEREIQRMMHIILNGNEEDYLEVYRSERVLKKDAKPSGLFKKSYKDSDYDQVEVLVRPTITIIAQSNTGRLGCREDYRERLDEAPYRTGVTTLQDGRVMVCNITGVGRVYSDSDQRMGNFFSHILLFPKGTKTQDIPFSQIKFLKGLERKWYGQGKLDAPELLEGTSLEKLISDSQTKSKEQVELNPLELLNESINNPNVKVRTESRIKFRHLVNKGLNTSELLLQLKEEQLDLLQNGTPYKELDDTLLTELIEMDSPFKRLLEKAKEVVTLKNKINELEDAQNYDLADAYQKELDNKKQQLNQEVSQMNLDELEKSCHSYREYLITCYKFDKIKNGENLNLISGPYMKTVDYQGINQIEMAIKQIKKMNRN